MHWGLTAFERKRIERIATDHPYFDMHAPLLTKKELRTILAQCPRKTGPQVIVEVKNELGIAHAPETQEKRTLAEALHDASFVPSFRRMVVLSIFCLLLVLFMTLTVPGKAFAEEIYSLVIDFVDGVFGISNVVPTKNDSTLNFSSLPDDIETLQELTTVIGSSILISDNTLSSFQYSVMEGKVLTVRSRYETHDGKSFSVVQRIDESGIFWTSRNDVDGSVFAITSNNGLDLYTMTATDGAAVIKGYAESYMITITSRTIDIAELLSYAKAMHPVT